MGGMGMITVVVILLAISGLCVAWQSHKHSEAIADLEERIAKQETDMAALAADVGSALFKSDKADKDLAELRNEMHNEGKAALLLIDKASTDLTEASVSTARSLTDIKDRLIALETAPKPDKPEPKADPGGSWTRTKARASRG